MNRAKPRRPPASVARREKIGEPPDRARVATRGKIVYTIVVVIGSGFGAKGALPRTSPAATLEISRRKVVRMSAISGKRRLAAVLAALGAMLAVYALDYALVDVMVEPPEVISVSGAVAECRRTPDGLVLLLDAAEDVWLTFDGLPEEDCISRNIAVSESDNNTLQDILCALNSSVDKTTTVSLFLGNHEFINDNGCSFYCIGLTTQVAGISGILSAGNGGPVSVSYGEGTRVAAASADFNGGSIGAGVGVSSYPIQGDVRLLCISFNSEDNDGCQCADRAPKTLFGTIL